MSEKETGSASAPLDGIKALAIALGNLPHDQAAYKRERLPQAVTDDWGTHTEKRTLAIGRARIQEEIDTGAVLMFSIFGPDGTKKVVGIGQTPAKYDPSRGGQKMLGAGRDNHNTDPYWMLVHQGIDNTPAKPYYLSVEQLRGISVAPGDETVTLNPFMEDATHGTVVQVAGRVETVALLE